MLAALHHLIVAMMDYLLGWLLRFPSDVQLIGIATLSAVVLTNLSDLKKVDLTAFWVEHPLVRILCEQPAIWCVPLAIGLMVVVSKATAATVPADIRMKMLVLHAPEALGLRQEYIRDQEGH